MALLGPQVADKLFGRHEDITGETIRIEGQPFRVIGVLESKGGGSFGSQDNVVLMPLTTAQARLIRRSRDQVDVIYIQAVSSETVNQASSEVSDILRTRHRTALGADDFTVFSPAGFCRDRADDHRGADHLPGWRRGDLSAGGRDRHHEYHAGIVTERTREIGLRKAIGARKRDIMIQFLTESSLLSLWAG